VGESVENDPLREREPEFGWAAHANDVEALRAHVADLGVTPVQHNLSSIQSAALIAVTDKAHVARVGWQRKTRVLCHPSLPVSERLPRYLPHIVL
jgi:hypothetical protein